MGYSYFKIYCFSHALTEFTLILIIVGK